jgi:hypothetical protein
MPCVQLDAAGRCRLFNHPERPTVCGGLQPKQDMCGQDMCGKSREQALQYLTELERLTA